MDFLVNTFTFRPLVPFYLLLAGWLLAWLLAFVASRLMLGDGKKAWADIAAYRAWELGLGLHLTAALGVLSWLGYDAFASGAWLSPDARIYLLAYGTIVMIDAVLFAMLMQQKKASEAAVS